MSATKLLPHDAVQTSNSRRLWTKPFITTGFAAACSIASFLASSQVQAQAAEARWFEVEVILIQQLQDDASYNENFKNLNVKARQSKHNIDLIHQYLRQVNDLTYLLAPCGANSQSMPIALENEQSWQELILTMPENFGEDLTNGMDNINGEPSTIIDQNNETEAANEVGQPQQTAPEYEYLLNERQGISQEVEAENVSGTEDQEITQQDLEAIDLDVDFTAQDDNHGLTPFTFNFYCHYTDSDTLLTPLDKMFYQIPKQIGGREDVYSSQPYMLSKDSLELTHIYQSLRRSREFRPLLHMAWRQPVLDARSALPVKLIAGSNLKYPKTNLLLQQGDAQQQSFDINELQQQRQALLNQHVNELVNTLEQGNIDSQALIANIKAGNSKQVITQNIDQQIELISNADKDEAMHLQDWFLEGFFKVHLDHYLFINSEFTMPIKAKGVDGNSDSSEEILVPFKQNRRVISGEIHYFDHPYMGMIVQIRRHSRPDPAEKDTQSENQ